MITVLEDRVRLTDQYGEPRLVFVLPGHGNTEGGIGVCCLKSGDFGLSAKEIKALGGALRGLAQKLLDRQKSAYVRGRKSGTAPRRSRLNHQS